MTLAEVRYGDHVEFTTWPPLWPGEDRTGIVEKVGRKYLLVRARSKVARTSKFYRPTFENAAKTRHRDKLLDICATSA